MKPEISCEYVVHDDETHIAAELRLPSMKPVETREVGARVLLDMLEVVRQNFQQEFGLALRERLDDELHVDDKEDSFVTDQRRSERDGQPHRQTQRCEGGASGGAGVVRCRGEKEEIPSCRWRKRRAIHSFPEYP